MSRLSSARDFRREIAELDAMLALDDRLTAEHGPDPAAEMASAGLRSRRAELLREMETRGDERMPGHELDITFGGRPVAGHSIESEFLGRMLEDIQELVRAVVAQFTGGLRNSGPIRERAKRRSVLRVATTYPGSFGIHFETADEQFDLEGEQISPVYRAIDFVVRLADGQVRDDDLLSLMAPLGKRAVDRYVDLLRDLEKHGAEMAVSWPTVSGPRISQMRSREAGRRRRRLDRVDVRSSVHREIGRLDEAGIRRSYFEFIADNGSVLKGDVAEHLIPVLKNFFDQRCRAVFTLTEVIDPVTHASSRSYRLDDLSREPATEE